MFTLNPILHFSLLFDFSNQQILVWNYKTKFNLNPFGNFKERKRMCVIHNRHKNTSVSLTCYHLLAPTSRFWPFAVCLWSVAAVPRLLYRGADKSLARPGRKQATATEYFDFQITYL